MELGNKQQLDSTRLDASSLQCVTILPFWSRLSNEIIAKGRRLEGGGGADAMPDAVAAVAAAAALQQAQDNEQLLGAEKVEFP